MLLDRGYRKVADDEWWESYCKVFQGGRDGIQTTASYFTNQVKKKPKKQKKIQVQLEVPVMGGDDKSRQMGKQEQEWAFLLQLETLKVS